MFTLMKFLNSQDFNKLYILIAPNFLSILLPEEYFVMYSGYSLSFILSPSKL